MKPCKLTTQFDAMHQIRYTKTKYYLTQDSILETFIEQTEHVNVDAAQKRPKANVTRQDFL